MSTRKRIRVLPHAAAVWLILAASGFAQDAGWERAQRIFKTSPRPVEALAALAESSPGGAWGHYFHGQALASAKRLAEGVSATERAESLVSVPREKAFLVAARADLQLRIGDVSEAEGLFGRAAALTDDAEAKSAYARRRDELARWRRTSSDATQRLWLGLGATLLVIALAFFLMRRALSR